MRWGWRDSFVLVSCWRKDDNNGHQKRKKSLNVSWMIQPFDSDLEVLVGGVCGDLINRGFIYYRE